MSDLETKILFYMYSRLCAGSTSVSASEIMERFNIPFCVAVEILEKLCSKNLTTRIPAHPFCRNN